MGWDEIGVQSLFHLFSLVEILNPDNYTVELYINTRHMSGINTSTPPKEIHGDRVINTQVTFSHSLGFIGLVKARARDR